MELHSMTLRAMVTIALVFVQACSHAQQADHPQASNETGVVEPESIAIQRVVITAQKRVQNEVDVPISLVAIDGATLEAARIASLQELSHSVPGLSVQDQEGFGVLTIRGVGGGGRNIGFDPRVGVYVDGIYMGQAQALRQPLFDVARVEVLRGPQGYLFGRNTDAGAINIVTAAPTKNLTGYLRGASGTHGTGEIYGSVSGSVADDVQGSLSVASERHGGWTTNLYDGGQLDDLKRTTWRARLATELGGQLQISLAADGSATRQKLLIGEPTTDLFDMPFVQAAPPARTVNLNTTPREDIDLSGAVASADYRSSDGHVVTAIIGHRRTHQERTTDNDYSPSDLLHVFFVDNFGQDSAELRVASPENRAWRYVAGVFRLHESATTNRKAIVGADVNTTLVRYPGIPAPVPFSTLTAVAPGAVISNDGVVTTDTRATFGTGEVDITSRLTLLLGARYSVETKRLLFDLDGSQSGNFEIGTLVGHRDSRGEQVLSPMAGIIYAIAPEWKVYAKYSRGFKSGGWNADFVGIDAAGAIGFGPESVDAYEVGAKSDVLGGAANYDMAAFVSRFAQYQVAQFVDLGQGSTAIELRNAASVHASGVEVSVRARPIRGFELGVRLAVTNSRFASFTGCAPGLDCSGHHLPYAPALSAAVSASYQAAFGGGVSRYGVDIAFKSNAYSDPVNDPANQKVPSNTLVNLRLEHTMPAAHWTLGAWVKNAFDRSTVESRGRDFLGNEYVRRVDPRIFGAEIKYML